MSALIAVSRAHAIDVLTDAAFVRGDDGTIAYLASKQFLTAVPFTVLGTTGWMPVNACFARLAHERCQDFDALVDACDDLWREAQQGVPADIVDYAIVLAGWSQRRGTLEMYSLTSVEICRSNALTVLVTGPCAAAGKATHAFQEKFASNPDAFVARRDGVALMEELRRFPRLFQTAAASCVGGYVQHTTVTRDGATADVIHRWPDCVGHRIALEAAT